MFSYGNNNNSNNNNNNNSPYHHQLAVPLYQYPSSSSHPLMSHDHTDNNILYHYYHQHPLLASHQLLPGYVTPENTTTAGSMVAAALNSSLTNASAVATNPLPERPMKKDRHSKIYTAQGLRDRRVRLSTEIARQFFDLQDLLGYDKASETIGWLLNKSKKDIKELVEMKANNNCTRGKKSLASSSDCEIFPETYQEVENDDEFEEIVSHNASQLMTGGGASGRDKKMKSYRANAAAFQLLRKESSREKAREKSTCATAEKFYQLRSSTSNVGEVGVEKSTDPIANLMPREDIMEESIMITRKLKPTATSSLGHHSNYQQNFSSCLPQNWDMNGATNESSSCCASTTMSLSTELLISGKPWEACNNQCLE